jgi:hypothetical protein
VLVPRDAASLTSWRDRFFDVHVRLSATGAAIGVVVFRAAHLAMRIPPETIAT